MSTPAHFSEAFCRILQHPTGGVVGLVDELLALCGDHELQLDWQGDQCRLRSFGGEWQVLKAIPPRKSVFRTILARIAALCNERIPNSVSPYGGQCELSGDATGSAGFRITFVNTPAEQRLELMTIPGDRS